MAGVHPGAGTKTRDKMKADNGNILGVGSKVHAANKAAVPPDKVKADDRDFLGMGANAHAADKAVVPPDKTKVVSLRHKRADHRSGLSGVRLGEHRSAHQSTWGKSLSRKKG